VAVKAAVGVIWGSCAGEILMKIVTHSRCLEYSSPGHPERPARVARTIQRLRDEKELPLEWAEPLSAPEDLLREAHSQKLLDRLEKHVDFDLDTPSHENLSEHARRSVGAALQALAFATQKESVFSLMRPPGHHATREKAMGFCYLNNAALATLAARKQGIARVAVFDFDVHHGNGTEDILVGRAGVVFHSIHQFPAYPGTGRRNRGDNCFNYPVPPGFSRLHYRDTATRALEQAMSFKPELLVISAGFDAYCRDPLCQQQLEAEDFHWIGETLRALNLPLLSLLEGGYSDDLPELILAYLRGLAGLKIQESALALGKSDGPEADADLEPLWGPSF
jgi:acetoin utilization deacetylase AcuC-like enzyme